MPRSRRWRAGTDSRPLTIAAALGNEPAGVKDNRWRSVVVSVLGFLGGTFVFAGIGVFVALQWDSMNSAARVIVTLGSGLSALVLALLSARDVRFGKATAPLLLVAAASSRRASSWRSTSSAPAETGATRG